MEGIQIGLQIDLLIFSSIICIVMYVYLVKNTHRDSRSLELFKYIVLATTVIGLVEIVTLIFAGGPRSVDRIILYWSSALFLSLTALPGALWLVYLDYKIIRKAGNYKLRYMFYFIPTVYFIVDCLIVNTVFVKGYVFTINELNRYVRGQALWMHIVVMYLVMIIAVINFYRSSHMIRGRVTQVVLIVVIVPIIGNILQMLFYGITVSVPSYVLAAFMVYLILEKDEMQRDNLTKLYTRSYLENRVTHKLAVREKFSLIMLDLNDFKNINDTYGHHAGDQALIKVATLLEENIGIEDAVCRYGGDEFVVIVEDVKDIGKSKIKQFDERIEKENLNIEEYNIHVSYGLKYVDYTQEYSMYELLKLIDKNMYEDKKKRKGIS